MTSSTSYFILGKFLNEIGLPGPVMDHNLLSEYLMSSQATLSSSLYVESQSPLSPRNGFSESEAAIPLCVSRFLSNWHGLSPFTRVRFVDR